MDMDIKPDNEERSLESSTGNELRAGVLGALAALAAVVVLGGLLFAWKSRSVDIPLVSEQSSSTQEGENPLVAEAEKPESDVVPVPSRAELESCVGRFNNQGHATQFAKFNVNNGTGRATVIATPTGYCQVFLISRAGISVFETNPYSPDRFTSPGTGRFGGDGVEPFTETPPAYRTTNSTAAFTDGRITLDDEFQNVVTGESAPEGTPPQTGTGKVAEVPWDAGAQFYVLPGQVCPGDYETRTYAGDQYPSCVLPGD